MICIPFVSFSKFLSDINKYIQIFFIDLCRSKCRSVKPEVDIQFLANFVWINLIFNMIN
jgi:hypothetical protein